MASRSLDRAEAFAARHGIERAHGSYAEILADPDVDVLYVATPHPSTTPSRWPPCAPARRCWWRRRSPPTAAGAEEIVDAGAGDRRLRHGGDVDALPAGRRGRAGADRRRRDRRGPLGAGRPRGGAASTTPTDRLFDLALGGGALLDLGVYVVSFAQMLLGTPSRVVAAGSLFPSGADAEAALLLGYGDGRTATLHGVAAQRAARAGPGLRDDGVDRRPPPLPPPGDDRAAPRRRRARDDHPAADRRGLRARADRGHRVPAGRAAESAVMPLADTLAVQRLLGEAAEQLGVRHAEDPAVL